MWGRRAGRDWWHLARGRAEAARDPQAGVSQGGASMHVLRSPGHKLISDVLPLSGCKATVGSMEVKRSQQRKAFVLIPAAWPLCLCPLLPRESRRHLRLCRARASWGMSRAGPDERLRLLPWTGPEATGHRGSWTAH